MHIHTLKIKYIFNKMIVVIGSRMTAIFLLDFSNCAKTPEAARMTVCYSWLKHRGLKGWLKRCRACCTSIRTWAWPLELT